MKEFTVLPRKGMQPATSEDLQNAGKPYTGITFRAGQLIEFPPAEQMNPHIDFLGSGAHKVYCLNGSIDGVAQWIPFGCFNKTPYGIHGPEFLEKNPVNNELCGYPNFEAATKAYAGRSLRVKEMHTGPKALFRKSKDGGFEHRLNEDNTVATQPVGFPIFEWVDTKK